MDSMEYQDKYVTKDQRQKLQELVEYARTHSEYYKELYKKVPATIHSLEELPTTRKSDLMSHFDDWVTDKSITIDELSRFIADSSLIGSKFHDKYHVAITSGTTGKNGFFITNPAETKLSAKINKKSKFSWMGAGNMAKLLVRGVRIAAITAVGEHYGFISGIVHMKSEGRYWADRIRVISIHDPVSRIVSELNAFQPTIIMGYASMIAMMTSEQSAGRLAVKPVFIEVMSEKLTDSEFEKVGSVFHVKPYQMYGATEIPFASPLCKCGWYHMNTKAVILEPIDEKGEHVLAGTMSHSLLITNLLNRTQPMIRYDIGDSILINPDKCQCGNKNPSFKVQGRSADSLHMVNDEGEQFMVPALMFVTLIDKFVQGADAFQVIQTAPSVLEIRLQYPPEIKESLRDQQWEQLCDELKKLLQDRKLNKVTIVRSLELPKREKGGKFRMVVPYRR